jgi:hypothetical protein
MGTFEATLKLSRSKQGNNQFIRSIRRSADGYLHEVGAGAEQNASANPEVLVERGPYRSSGYATLGDKVGNQWERNSPPE